MKRPLMIAALLPLFGVSTVAQAHGGLQQSTDVYFRSDGNPIVETTYGLLTLNDENIWTWVCEEISGTESAWHFALSQNDRWLLTGIDRAMWSDDGCDWTDVNGDIFGRYITAVEPDPNDHAVFWAVTASGTVENGLFRSQNDGESFELVQTFGEGARLRDVEIHPNGSQWVVGWRDDLPWLWNSTDGLSWTETQLDADSYSVSILTLDPNDTHTAWLKLITAEGDRIVRAKLDGTSETVLDTPNAIDTMVVLPESGHLLLGGRDVGLYRSTDSGATWTGPHAAPDPGCLQVHDNSLYICGSNWIDGAALFKTPLSETAPDEWEWTPVLNFGDVRSVLECHSTSLTYLYCEPLWETVVLEGGFDRQPNIDIDTGTTEPDDTGLHAESHCGCIASPRRTRTWLLLPMFLWFSQRRARRVA